MLVIKNMTIKQKLIAITMLTCLASLTITGIGYMAWEWSDIHNDLVYQLSTYAELIAENCKAALSFNDQQDAKETLRALQVEPSIVCACIHKIDGELFATYTPTKNIIDLSKLEGNSYHFEKGFLTVQRDIELDGDILGTVYLKADLHPLYIALGTKILIIVGVIFLASLAAYAVSSKLQRIISEPILELARTAKKVSQMNILIFRM